MTVFFYNTVIATNIFILGLTTYHYLSKHTSLTSGSKLTCKPGL